VATEAADGFSRLTPLSCDSLLKGQVDSLQNLNTAKYELLANAEA